MSRILSRMIVLGRIIRVSGEGRYAVYRKAEIPNPIKNIRCDFYKQREDDVRTFPRLGKKFIDVAELAKYVLQKYGPMTLEELNIACNNRVVELKKKEEKGNGGT